MAGLLGQRQEDGMIEESDTDVANGQRGFNVGVEGGRNVIYTRLTDIFLSFENAFCSTISSFSIYPSKQTQDFLDTHRCSRRQSSYSGLHSCVKKSKSALACLAARVSLLLPYSTHLPYYAWSSTWTRLFRTV